jgi:hypothetical protein
LDPPDLASMTVAACSMFFGKEFSLRVFPSWGLNRRKGDVRRWTRRSHPLVARPRGGPRHHQVWLPWSASDSPLDSVFMSGN